MASYSAMKSCNMPIVCAATYTIRMTTAASMILLQRRPHMYVQHDRRVKYPNILRYLELGYRVVRVQLRRGGVRMNPAPSAGERIRMLVCRRSLRVGAWGSETISADV